MSRVGKKVINIPEGVQVGITDTEVSVSGKNGKMNMNLHAYVAVTQKDDTLQVVLKDPTKNHGAIWGMSRAKLANMIEGVSKGFERVLELKGVGYRVALKGNQLDFTLGYSHPINFKLPEGVQAKVQKDNVVILSSIYKEHLGKTSAQIRSLRVPDVYQNKGVRYQGEKLRKKAGKSGASKGG